jgi:putative Holliday junction resolvase
VVVGLPRRHDGSDSKQTQRVRAFARALEAAGLEVAFEDERYTSQLAQRRLHQGGAGRAQRREKGRLDEAAAVLILESYLARRRRGTAS